MPTTVQVTFMGICTHLWESQVHALPNPAFGKRIVVPNASDPNVIALINDKYQLHPPHGVPIEPHIATLTVVRDGGENIELTLEGATVTIPTDEAGPIQKDARCMPGLGSFVADLAPGPACTTKDAALASCHFDFEAGLVFGRGLQAMGGAASILYETTMSDQVEPRVVIKPFDGSPEMVLSLQSPFPGIAYQVVISNFPAAGIPDNDNDFVLHYLAAGSWPEAVPTIDPVTCTQHPNGSHLLHAIGGKRSHFDFGMGCSNSNFP